MRIALLVTDLQRGGTPLRLARLARGLKQAKLTVHVGCLAPPGPVSDELEADGIPTFACNARGARDLFALQRLRRHLQRIGPDLIHATLTHANVAARLIGRRMGIPVVTSTATIEVERRWHRTVECCTAWMDRGHIVNSAALAEHVERAFKLPRDRIHVIPPLPPPLPDVVDRAAARAALSLPNDAFVLLWAGRFDPVKRIDVVIGSLELLPTERYHLLLAGDGPSRDQIEAIIAHSPARRRIHPLGWQNNLGQAMAAADVFVFPSLTEGMPNTVLQAMAAGVPVVGSDIPTLRELAGDKQRIRLVSGSTAADYAAVLRDLLADDAERETVGRRGAEWARQNLDPKRAIDATIAVYSRVLQSNQ